MGMIESLFKLIKIIRPHYDTVHSISTFPSGNIISVSYDKSIKIYDSHFNNIQEIPNAHDNFINYVYVKDENNFVTCSWDNNIKTWIKITNSKNLKQNKFNLNKIIPKAHKYDTLCVIYTNNDKIISCSRDKTIKIWEKNNKFEYQLITILQNFNRVNSLLLIEDKNYLISSGDSGTKIWNYQNFECLFYLQNAICYNNNALKRYDNDRIIVGGNKGKIKVISLSEKTIIKEINNIFECYAICVLKEKNIFLIGGESKDIKIYNFNHYGFIETIQNIDEEMVFGLTKLKDGSIVSYGMDKKIKIFRVRSK